MSAAVPTTEATGGRWSLSRAGIMNVYQYDDEVLDLAGGRLLLRGVNGSGKSTAMNMLLPFLLTARQARIDAAGEQTSVLKSWMLSGRDEAQPIGYLWIELGNGHEHLACGCGIKANRAADTVTTWWFVTGRRPVIDLQLVESGVPLSADALRAELDGDPVFSHAQRADYRHEIRRRLFGGAELDQHLRLLDAVRNPRMGERFDRGLPDHLTNALPELSSQSVDEAARPLEDLDEHRRNVGALHSTCAALDALAEVYRSYVMTELGQLRAQGRDSLRQLDRDTAELNRRRRRATEAGQRETAAAAEVVSLEAGEARLTGEIATLQASTAYEDGKQLEGYREQVRLLSEQHRNLGNEQTELVGQREEGLAALSGEAAATESDAALVVDRLTDLGRVAASAGVAVRFPPAPVIERTTVADGAGAVPAARYDPEPLGRSLDAAVSAARARSADLDKVVRSNTEVAAALAALERAEREVELLSGYVASAEEANRGARSELSGQIETWRAAIGRWAAEIGPLARTVAFGVPVIDAVAPAGRSAPAGADGQAEERGGVPEELRAELVAEAAGLVSDRQRAAATARSGRVEAEREVAEAARLAAELAERDEPDPPHLPWQIRDQPCLADLVDFAPDLDPTARAGLEGALEASGLLAAALTTTGLELADGELIAVSDIAADEPLSRLLKVTVPIGDSPPVDAGLVHKVLDSISTKPGGARAPGGPGAAAATDGTFRIGPLTGRHLKAEAEHIGVTARRARLERLRAEAATALASAEAALAKRRAVHDRHDEERRQAEHLAGSLPGLEPVHRARAAVAQAEIQLGNRRAEFDDADQLRSEADADHAARADERDRVAATLQLPTADPDLRQVRDRLDDLRNGCDRCRQAAGSLRRSVQHWMREAEHWHKLARRLDETTRKLGETARRLDVDASKLAALEDSIGLPYQEVKAAIELASDDLDAVTERLPLARSAKDDTLRATIHAQAEVDTAQGLVATATDETIEQVVRLRAALAVPGLLDAVVAARDDDPGPRPERGESGSGEATAPLDLAGIGDSVEGLRLLLDRLDAVVEVPPSEVSADGVRQSVRQRRDALGAGWDAEDRQPDPLLPLAVLVEGPLGRMPLPAALVTAKASHRRLAGLLTTKQDTALRDLLQGLVAREVAEKLYRAGEIIAAMNRHLVDVTTAHGIGVELRWRRRADLDSVPDRMVDLLAKLPDLRTDDEEHELRALVSARLDDARRLEPELSYRQLIGETLDYRRWYEMTVLLRRGPNPLQKLTARVAGTLSEGEKKLVTYLPFLAAVAVSYDALAEHAADVPRFVMLDDAMAKVSEDNHADLLGLLVDLDLDFIATSERLWGTHATVPCLSIVEVVRDAELGAIILERFRWDGHTLEAGSGHR